MNLDQIDALAGTLPASFMVVQWHGSHVWKVGLPEKNKPEKNRMFAIAYERDGLRVTFKTNEMLGEVLRGDERFGPAPHLPNGGWLQSRAPVEADEWRDLLAVSHELAAAGLTKATRAAAGLGQLPGGP